MRACFSSENGLARDAASIFRCLNPPASRAVVFAASSASFNFPSRSTKSSKLMPRTFSLCSPLLERRFSSIMRPLSRISSLALRRRSPASALSSSRVEASSELERRFELDGREELELELEFEVEGRGGWISSPRECRAMAILRRDSSTQWRTWGFS